MMVTIQNGELVPVFFEDMVDPATNRTRIRTVNLDSYSYSVARAYMIRLECADFESPQSLQALADEARMTPEEFRERFERVVNISARHYHEYATCPVSLGA
jgi:6-phosphofructokinase 1